MIRFLFVLSTVLAIGFGSKIPSVRLLDSRIVGGLPTDIEDIPYQVSLQAKSGSSTYHICGGSIIGQRIILTAAHCLLGQEANNLQVLAGVTIIKPVPQASLLTVENIIIHEDYDLETFDNDVGLIILEDALTFGATINKIDLASSNRAVDSTEALVSGWGRTIPNDPEMSDTLQSVQVPVLDDEYCRKKYEMYKKSMICAGYLEGGKDSCVGDSGGPLVMENQLIGIVSFGKGCALPGYPGVYSSVASHHNWIVANAGAYL